MKRKKSCLYLVAILAPMAFPAPALAQQQHAESPVDDSASYDIIVTAQRRAERLQDVPIAVSAITGAQADAAGISGTATLQASVPSLVVQRQSNGAVPFLRGIGSTIGDANAESSVAIYLDGVYQPAAFGNFFEFSNIERVEVLKGPQGTLFGRNATGGVIQVITKDPSDSVEGSFNVGVANYETVAADAYVSTPLTDTLAFNIAANYQVQNEGWGHNLIDGTEIRGSRDYGARAKLLFTPGDNTEIRLSGNYAKTVNSGINGQPVPGARTLPFTGGLGYPGRFNNWSDHKSVGKSEIRAVALHVNHDFDAFHFVNISSYNKTTGFANVDVDLSPAPLLSADFDQSSKTFTQEIQLQSPASSKLQWVVGGYYYHRDVSQLVNLRGLFLAPLPDGVDQLAKSKVRSKSLFAQATYPLGEQTNFTAGFRYSWEKITGTASDFLGGTSIPADPRNGTVDSFDYGKPTWRLSLDHKFTPDIMAYASYNRGTKSGNYSLSAGIDALASPYLPEQLDAYEVGLKTQLFDRDVRLNLSAFYYDFKNYQFQKFLGGAAFVFNGPGAKSYGGEIELEVRPTSRLTLNGNIGLLHTRIDDFPGAPNSCRSNATGVTDEGGFFCDPVTGESTTVPFNAVGNRLPNAPEVSGNAGFNYVLPTTSGSFQFAANVYHFGGAPAEIGNRLNYRSYTTLSGSITWTDPADQFSVRVWGRNLTNQYFYSQISALPGTIDLGVPAAPRTYGVTIGYDF